MQVKAVFITGAGKYDDPINTIENKIGAIFRDGKRGRGEQIKCG